jgi:hypothetical protein
VSVINGSEQNQFLLYFGKAAEKIPYNAINTAALKKKKVRKEKP